MNINMYVINAILILMVIRQIREHPLDLRSLAVPVLAVGCAAALFLHSVPAAAATSRWNWRAYWRERSWARSAA